MAKKFPHERLYSLGRVRPHELQEAAKGQPSGLSTPKNVAEWSRYASRNSGPKIAPGLGKGTDHRREEDRRHVEPDRTGWAAKRGE